MQDQPPPYGDIAAAMRSGQVIPFLGAGVNFGVLPLGTELSMTLSIGSQFPSQRVCECDRKELTTTAQYTEMADGRGFLHDILRSRFAAQPPPCRIHQLLAEIKSLRLIITTNYDDLVERAFVERKRPYYVVIYPADRVQYGDLLWFWAYDPQQPERKFIPESIVPNELARKIEQPFTIIYKMHGSVIHEQEALDSYVITEDDYVDFLSRLANQSAVPPLFKEYFRNSHFLFLGYGLADWNWRVILRELCLARRPGWRKSWAIQLAPSELQQIFWQKRDVNIYNLDINAFVTSLSQALGDIVSDSFPSAQIASVRSDHD